ncbi:MAG TPA: LysM peptidoglycan-binding domain-containing protein [Syntrophales bacterium]|nr:LysM peptidoglycan-binding domain-containing protein [Syntrophales bacterium]
MRRRKALYGLLAFIISLTLISAGACTKTAGVKDVGAGGQAQKEATAGSQKVAPESQAGAKAAPAGEAVTGEAKAKARGKAAAGKLETYVVKKGDCLWTIAKKKSVYNDPFLWPLVFEANKDKIKNPNRIYPGQKLQIPRGGLSMDQIKDARKKAGAKKPYTPPKAAVVPVS